MLDGECTQRGDGERGDDRHQDLQRLLVSADGMEDSDEGAECGRSGDVARCGLQYQTQPHREDRVPGDAAQRPESRPQLAYLDQSAEPVGGPDGASFRILQQTIDGGDLVETR